MLEHMYLHEYLVIESEVHFSMVGFVVKDFIQTYYTHHGFVPQFVIRQIVSCTHALFPFFYYSMDLSAPKI